MAINQSRHLGMTVLGRSVEKIGSAETEKFSLRLERQFRCFTLHQSQTLSTYQC